MENFRHVEYTENEGKICLSMKKVILSIFILLVSLCLSACGDATQESGRVQLEDEHNDNTEAPEFNFDT